MSFIKKIFNNVKDEDVHRQFSRFSKGEFENKALIDITVGSKIKLKTSSEFVNELVKFLASTIKDKVSVKGVVFSTRDLSRESLIDFDEIKMAMGIRKHIVNKELTKEQIIGLCDNFPDASVNFTFETKYGSLKIKEKVPKSGKPGKGDTEPKADFCVLITGNKSILEEYAFDVKNNFKKLFIKHKYVINGIDIPEKYKNDFAMARKMGIRKGKIIRYLKVDGKEIENEVDFEI